MKLHDLITVVVSEKSVMTSDSQMDREKKGYGDLILPDWILLKGLRKVVPDPQSGRRPPAHPRRNRQQAATQGQLQTTDTLTFHIACEVVDIRPNGNLVLEGHRSDQEQRRGVGVLAQRRDPRRTAIAARTTRCSARTSRRCGSTSGKRPRPRQLSPRLGPGVAGQVAAVLRRSLAATFANAGNSSWNTHRKWIGMRRLEPCLPWAMVAACLGRRRARPRRG